MGMQVGAVMLPGQICLRCFVVGSWAKHVLEISLHRPSIICADVRESVAQKVRKEVLCAAAGEDLALPRLTTSDGSNDDAGSTSGRQSRRTKPKV